MKSIAARVIQASASALFLAFFGVSALAQAPGSSGYPTKPIRLVVPFTPGGSTDVLARAIGQELTKAWGQSVVVENVPGAGGAIGADKVAKAAPDGYTLLMGHIGTLAVNPSLYPRLPYNPVKDFAPVAWVARVPNVLVVHPSVAARNVKELVALAKSRPGQLNYGSGGNGSAANLATEFLKLQTGTSLVHIPYRGTAPAVTDLMAGQIQLMFTGLPALVAPLKGGQLRALAVSSPQRLEALPGVPTVAESGYPGFEALSWQGVFAPAGTPPELVERISADVNKAVRAADVRDYFAARGFLVEGTTPAAFKTFLEAEVKKWSAIVKVSGAKAD